jgi:biotin/methionine sulfoxide reductase
MQLASPPYALARDDYDIFADLAERLGARQAFTEGRTSAEWLRRLYEPTRQGLAARGLEAPDFDTFWARREIVLPQQADDGGILRAFRADPAGRPLPTPSGKIEIASSVIAGFGYADCPGHPAWLPPADRPTPEYPLLLVANQPATRLHSQLDFGDHSKGAKRRGREVCRLHAQDATARGVADGDIVRVFSARGAFLACAQIAHDLMPGVIQVPTGVDPGVDAQGRPLCVHGNPNAVTRDVGTSSLAQGCTGQLTAVQLERFDEPLPPVHAFEPPPGQPAF